jgi:hypothetical protein
MTTATKRTNGLATVRTRRHAVLPTKIETAFKISKTKRDEHKTSRLDYAAGYEDGYRAALREIHANMVILERELKK